MKTLRALSKVELLVRIANQGVSTKKDCDAQPTPEERQEVWGYPLRSRVVNVLVVDVYEVEGADERMNKGWWSGWRYQ